MFRRKLGKRVSAPGVGRMLESVKRYTSFYKTVDAQVQTDIAAANRPVSCKLGCDACCRRVISISVFEAVNLLHAFSQDSFRAGRLNKVWPKVADQMAILQKGTTADDMRELGTECVFLMDNQCIVYNWRPCTCRVQTSFSDASQCAIPDAEIEYLDVSEIATSFTQLSNAIGKDLRVTTVPMPLPVALTFARAAFQDGLYSLRGSLKWAPDTRK